MATPGSRNCLARFRRTMGFVRADLFRIAAWALACAMAALAVWGAILSKLDADRAALRSEAFKEATARSKAYAAQLIRSVEQIDQIMLNLNYYWNESGSQLDLAKQVAAGLYPDSGQLYITILDRQGQRVASTIPGTQGGPNLSGRRYFRAHQADPGLGLRISEPIVGLRTGKLLIRFTRRLDAADGSFAGVIVVSTEPDYLAAFTDEASLGRDDFLAVARSDGPLLVSKTGSNMRDLPTLFRTRPTFPAQHGVVSLPGKDFTDERPRIVAWHALDSYPLISIVGLAEREIFAAHEAKARDYLNLGIAATALLILAAAAGIFFSTRMAWRKQQAELVKATYRLATDGARDGFYMVHALRDRNGYVVDFLVEDCNERGAAYYGMTRKELIGRTLRDLFPSDDYTSTVIGIFRSALETGYYEDEFKVSEHSSLRASWVHRRLVRSGDGLAVTLRDVSEAKAHEQALSDLANADAVTALPNRHWAMNYLPVAIHNARTKGFRLALLFVDLDDFKNVNDTQGHAAGDELLRAVAARLKSVIRPRDSVVRLGGDEFTLILEDIGTAEEVIPVAERLIRMFDEPLVLSDGSAHRVHASIGISLFPEDGEDHETLLKHADIAMYAAKASGKANYQFYQARFSQELLIRLNKEQALRKAIDADQFMLHYQPRVDTFSGELRGMEALVRWQHPERGLVSPLDFIPLAEETGLIVALGELVTRKVCAQLAQWQAEGLALVPVSINVSPRQFNHGTLHTLFSSCMAEYGIASSLLEIELTESCMMGEDQVVGAELEALEALGIKLLVDDFGTGYSSLSQLQRFDLDVLKVDRAFTARLDSGKEAEALFLAIVSMAHVLGMEVVAEGVETEQELRILQALSCNEVQGYLVSKPLPAEDIPAMLRKRFLLPQELLAR